MCTWNVLNGAGSPKKRVFLMLHTLKNIADFELKSPQNYTQSLNVSRLRGWLFSQNPTVDPNQNLNISC